jgi:hypothetical protein
MNGSMATVAAKSLTRDEARRIAGEHRQAAGAGAQGVRLRSAQRGPWSSIPLRRVRLRQDSCPLKSVMQ